MKNKKVFIDSNVFIALFIKNDSLHEKASKKWLELKKEEVYLFTSDLVISEVLTVLRLKAGKEVALGFGKIALEESEILNIIPVTQELINDSYSVFKEVENKDFSFVDASIVAVGRRLDMEVITFDEILKSVIFNLRGPTP